MNSILLHNSAVAAAFIVSGSALAVDINLVSISTPFPSPIWIDYHEPTHSVVMSVYYRGGVPYNFERVEADGTHVPFSTISGLTEE